MNEMDTRFANQFNIQWFPGHMTKTLRMMEQEIQHVDASLVLLDARIPLSSLNPEIERITARKPKLYALNKADLADPAVTEEWIRYFRAADAGCVAISAKQKGGTTAVKNAIEKELSGLLERRQNRGMSGAKTQVMLCGIPNVGKSTFINTFAGSARAKAADRPGVTKGKQWVSTEKFDLLDMPGVLWKKFDSKTTASNLAFIGSIKDDILDVEELAMNLLDEVRRNYPDLVAQRYKLDAETLALPPYELLEAIGRKRGLLRPHRRSSRTAPVQRRRIRTAEPRFPRPSGVSFLILLGKIDQIIPLRRALQRDAAPLAGAELVHQHNGAALGVHLAAAHQQTALAADGFHQLVGRQGQRFGIQLVALGHKVGVVAAYFIQQVHGQLFHVQNIVLDGADEGQIGCNGLGVKLLPQYAGHIQQIKFVGADPLLAFGHTRAVCRLGAGRACKGVDKGGLAHIRDAAQHHLGLGTAHAAVLAAFQQAGQFFFDRSLNGIGAALLLGADRHTAGVCCTEVSDPFFRYDRVGQICLVQRIELRLAGRDALDLRVQAGKRDAGIQQHKACIHMLDLLLHHAQGLGHVAREPLNIVLVCKAGIHFVHFTTPKSVKGIKHTSTLPRISRSSMQPT